MAVPVNLDDLSCTFVRRDSFHILSRNKKLAKQNEAEEEEYMRLMALEH